MALILTGPLIADIRGAIAGTHFKANAGHHSICHTPTHNKLHRHPIPQTALSTLTVRAAWKALTAAQRTLWANALAALQLSHALATNIAAWSPLDLFCHHNIVRHIAALSIMTSPPSRYTLANPLIPALYFLNFSTLAYRFDLYPLLAGEYALFDISLGFSPAATNPRTWYRYRNIVAGPNSSWITFAAPTPYQRGAAILAKHRRLDNARFTSPPTYVRLLWP